MSSSVTNTVIDHICILGMEVDLAWNGGSCEGIY